jgi:hypothetical protein
MHRGRETARARIASLSIDTPATAIQAIRQQLAAWLRTTHDYKSHYRSS